MTSAVSTNSNPHESELTSAVEAKRLAAEIIGTWPTDRDFDARRLLQEHSELTVCRSAVLDLAYEQYCRERDAGHSIDRHSFAGRFPEHQRTLLNLLEAHEAFEECPGLALPAQPAAWPEAGQEFLHFDLQAELGRGSFSRVFLAEEIPVGRRTVVVKICVGGANEADILGRLEHPHIGRIYAVQEDDVTGLTAICMPYVSTQTLTDIIDGEFSDNGANNSSADVAASNHVAGVIGIGADIAAALEFTHSRGIVHGDIKPSNILVAEGSATLIDFNLSVRHDAVDSIRGGTLVYMSPQQLQALAEGQRDIDCNPQDDVYSLGVTLWEAATGRLPWGHVESQNNDRREVIRDLLDRQQRKELPGDHPARKLPGELVEIIRRCLSVDAKQRPSAAELSSLLRALHRKTVGPSRRRRLVAGLSAALIAVISVVCFVHFSGTNSPPANGAVQDAGGKKNGAETPLTVHQAIAEIKDGKYDSAVRLLLKLQEVETKNPQVFALLGYCRARQAEAEAAKDPKLAFRRSQEAIGLFQQALGKGHPQKDLLLDNIGFCRYYANRTRPRDFKMPPVEVQNAGEQEVFKKLADGLARTTRSNGRIPLDLDLVEFAAQKYFHSIDIQSTAACNFAVAAHHTPPENIELQEKYQERALEYAWRSLDADGKPSFRLRYISGSQIALSEHPEFIRITNRAAGKLRLRLPEAASKAVSD